MTAAAKRVFRSDEETTMRELVAAKLRADFPDARIVHELPLRYSTNRIDVAAIRADEIIAVEVKSSRDVITRLEAQLRAFHPVTSRLYVALAPKWNEQLPPLEERHAGHTAFIPQYTEAQQIVRRIDSAEIGIWTVDAGQGRIETTQDLYRRRYPWTWQLLHMLHVAELLEIAARHRIVPPGRHHDLVNACADLMTGREIINAVCGALRSRAAFAAQSDPPLSP